MFDQFSHLVADASAWAYLVIAAFALLDALLPVIPSETVVITAGVVAAGGDLLLPLVLVAAATGAFAGDSAGYALGHRYGQRAAGRFLSRSRVAWAQRQLDLRAGELIVVARFIPGGRTAVTLTSGTVRIPWPRFARYDALAAVLWSTYAATLGFVGGKAFETDPWKGLGVAMGVALAITIGVEVTRRLVGHHRR